MAVGVNFKFIVFSGQSSPIIFDRMQGTLALNASKIN